MPLTRDEVKAKEANGEAGSTYSQPVGELYGAVTPTASISWIWPPQITQYDNANNPIFTLHGTVAAHRIKP